MLSLNTSRHHYREPKARARLIRRLVIAAIILVAVVLFAIFGLKWYNDFNSRPPVSVTYVHHDTDKKTVVPQKAFTTVTYLSTPLTRGASGELKVATTPTAICTVVLNFGMSAKVNLPTLKKQKANDKGVVTWHWVAASNASPGIYPVNISCGDNYSNAKAEDKLEIK